MKKYFILVLFIASCINAQQKDPQKILDAVVGKFNKVKDYQADITAKVDISFIKVPDTKAKVYFKQPNKVKIDSKGFAMLPKQSVNFSPADLLKGNYNTFFVKTEKIDDTTLDVIKIIPNSDSTDIFLSTFWIDTAQSLIKKVEMNGKRTGTTTVTLEYGNPQYSLPSKVIFSFNLGDVNLPQQSQSNQKPEEHRGRTQGLSGSVILTYSNYVINKGIPDSIFEEKKK
jgi:outer membrane lipoprotein-sorting protein